MKEKATFILTLLLLFIFTTLSGCCNSDNKSDQITEAENISSAESQFISDAEKAAEYEPKPWQRAYADYIDEFWSDKEPECSMTYIDDDDIPELFISTPAEASGEIVVTYYNGNLHTCQLSRIGSQYIERSGLIYSNNGHMWCFPVTITKLENGEFSVLGSGIREYSVDENENHINKYTWQNESVSEEEFNNNIDELFDREKGMRPQRVYSPEEMLSKLRTGVYTSYGHRYEIIHEDVSSWSEAQENCKRKGGYLATITSPDEYDTIIAQIKNENKTDISFYVGYRDSERIGEEFLGPRWINPDDTFTYNSSSVPNQYSSPDYEKDKWDSDNQDCGLVKYYNSANLLYLFNAPERLLDISPEYSDKMGYICEFDQSDPIK